MRRPDPIGGAADLGSLSSVPHDQSLDAASEMKSMSSERDNRPASREHAVPGQTQELDHMHCRCRLDDRCS